MRTLLLATLLTACAADIDYVEMPAPESAAPPVPGRIVLLSPGLEEPLAIAVARWTEHWGEAPYATDPAAEVEVEILVVDDLDRGIAGLAVGNRAHGGCNIYIADDVPYLPEYAADLLTHELGHCLGFGHDYDDAGSVMHPAGLPGQQLREHHR